MGVVDPVVAVDVGRAGQAEGGRVPLPRERRSGPPVDVGAVGVPDTPGTLVLSRLENQSRAGAGVTSTGTGMAWLQVPAASWARSTRVQRPGVQPVTSTVAARE